MIDLHYMWYFISYFFMIFHTDLWVCLGKQERILSVSQWDILALLGKAVLFVHRQTFSISDPTHRMPLLLLSHRDRFAERHWGTETLLITNSHFKKLGL